LPFARARHGDPLTSQLAAASVQGISRSQENILAIYTHLGPMTDGDLIHAYDQMASAGDFPPLSVSGIRTRGSELFAQGHLVDTGRRGETAAGRKCIIWAAATLSRTA
jgi:hypothetical protein